MKRPVIIFITAIIGVIVILCGLYFLRRYWIHRYDGVILREATRYHIDPDLVWSIAYEESYFRPWMKGRDGEIGIMQVTPDVLHDWASENGSASTQQRTANSPENFLRDPERNIQIACWYLEKAGKEFSDVSDREARMLAAYNAGRRRAADWNHVDAGSPPLNEQEFIARIDIPSTRAYLSSILERYRRVKSSKGGFSLVTEGVGLPGKLTAFARINAKNLFSALGTSDQLGRS
ncbi:MAG TPA: transglycosylase SLT domain-containing protein [Pyrinomonadaceae bacterium]|nr:transglycosylase SLT domain-containing protein [Pyrinomonadaceae bacterium]